VFITLGHATTQANQQPYLDCLPVYRCLQRNVYQCLKTALCAAQCLSDPDTQRKPMSREVNIGPQSMLWLVKRRDFDTCPKNHPVQDYRVHHYPDCRHHS